jgi:hypothetical protein
MVKTEEVVEVSLGVTFPRLHHRVPQTDPIPQSRPLQFYRVSRTMLAMAVSGNIEFLRLCSAHMIQSARERNGIEAISAGSREDVRAVPFPHRFIKFHSDPDFTFALASAIRVGSNYDCIPKMSDTNETNDSSS